MIKPLCIEVSSIVPGETYGQVCDKLEELVKQVVESGNTSKSALSVLAYALMEAPADFDYGRVDPPLKKAREFLSKQDETVRSAFRSECEKLPRYHPARVNALLSPSPV